MKNNYPIEDLALVSMVKERPDNCSLELKELINRHSGIYLDIVNNYIPSNCAFLRKTDVLDEKDYRIYQAALKYDDTRGAKFSTYLGNETKWMCMNLFNKNKKHPCVSIDEAPYIDHELESSYSLDRDTFNKIISMAQAHPDKRVFKIFKLRYIDGDFNKLMPWQKIAIKIEMSIQGCINIHNNAIENFKLKLEKELKC
jgi:hypothetical protein